MKSLALGMYRNKFDRFYVCVGIFVKNDVAFLTAARKPKNSGINSGKRHEMFPVAPDCFGSTQVLQKAAGGVAMISDSQKH